MCNLYASNKVSFWVWCNLVICVGARLCPWPPCELFTRCIKCELAASSDRSETCVWVYGMHVVPTLSCAPHAGSCAAVFTISPFLFIILSFYLSLSLSHSQRLMMFCGHVLIGPTAPAGSHTPTQAGRHVRARLLTRTTQHPTTCFQPLTHIHTCLQPSLYFKHSAQNTTVRKLHSQLTFVFIEWQEACLCCCALCNIWVRFNFYLQAL